MNTQVHDATKERPYELVFGQPPRSLMLPDATKRGVIKEEDVSLDQDDAVHYSIPCRMDLADARQLCTKYLHV